MFRQTRGVSNTVLAVIVTFGVGSGYYIWAPAIKKVKQENNKPLEPPVSGPSLAEKAFAKWIELTIDQPMAKLSAVVKLTASVAAVVLSGFGLFTIGIPTYRRYKLDIYEREIKSMVKHKGDWRQTQQSLF